MPLRSVFTAATACFLMVGASLAQDAKPATPPAQKITYDEHVRPIFREHCFSCHSADKQESGLALDSYQKTMAGGSSGEIVLPGDLASSRLWALVSHAEEPKMPPRQDKLAAAKLDLLSKWIELGAPENAGSKVTVKKNPLAALGAAGAKPDGPAIMPTGLVTQPVVFTKRPGQVTALATSPVAPLAAIAGQKQIVLYNTDSGELVGVLPFLEGIPHILRFSRTGSVLLAGGGRAGHSGCVALYDVKSGKRLAKIGDELDAVLAADINAAQTLVALGGPSKVVRLYSIETGELKHEIRKHTDWIYAAEFSPDGKHLATADRSGGLFVWEAETAREEQNLRGHSGAIFDLTWRGDSGVLATAGEDATAKLWNVDEGKVLKSWSAHAGGALAVRFAPDGSLVTAGRDKVVKTWTPDGNAQKSLPTFTELALRCAFTSDGKSVIAGDWLGNVKQFTASDAKEVRTLVANPATIAVRLESAKAALAEGQKATDAAAKQLAAAEEALKKSQAALAAAAATQKSVAAAIAALAPAKDAAPNAALKPETLKAATDALTAAAAAAEAASKKLTEEQKAAQAEIAAKQQASQKSAAAVASAKAALAKAEQDEQAFSAHAERLAAAVQAAQDELRAFQEAYSQAGLQVTSK